MLFFSRAGDSVTGSVVPGCVVGCVVGCVTGGVVGVGVGLNVCEVVVELELLTAAKAMEETKKYSVQVRLIPKHPSCIHFCQVNCTMIRL